MMTPYQVLFPDGSVLHGSAALAERPGREEMERFVAPYLASRMRHLIVQYGGHMRDMFVGELAGFRLSRNPLDADLALNHTATAIYREALLGDCPTVDEDTLPTISGAAVLFETTLM